MRPGMVVQLLFGEHVRVYLRHGPWLALQRLLLFLNHGVQPLDAMSILELLGIFPGHRRKCSLWNHALAMRGLCGISHVLRKKAPLEIHARHLPVMLPPATLDGRNLAGSIGQHSSTTPTAPGSAGQCARRRGTGAHPRPWRLWLRMRRLARSPVQALRLGQRGLRCCHGGGGWGCQGNEACAHG